MRRREFCSPGAAAAIGSWFEPQLPALHWPPKIAAENEGLVGRLAEAFFPDLCETRTDSCNHPRGFVVIGASKSDLTRRIAVLGAPIDIGASQRGTLMGPAALRTAGLLTLLGGLGFEVSDHGDLLINEVAELDDAPPDNARHYT